jgi:hypothetical protein
MLAFNRKGRIVKVERKSRFGYRGPKQRYSVFKAERNQKWMPFEEEEFHRRCERYDLDPDQFLSEEDGPNRKWARGLSRLRDYVKNVKHGYAIVRLDNFHRPEVPIQDTINIVRVVWSQEEAEKEVARLNELNGDKGCMYFWQLTRVKDKES